MTQAKANAFQLRNLDKLATYLEKLPADYDHFGMQIFSTEAYQPSRSKMNQCGAVACAVGHGPNAGIRANLNLDRDWSDYANRTLTGAEVDDNNEWTHGKFVWNWLFDGGWEIHDNTHTGAAARIRYYLAKGLPKMFNGQDMFPLDRDDDSHSRWYKRTMNAFANEQAVGG